MPDVLILFINEDRAAARTCGEYLTRVGYNVDFANPAPKRLRGNDEIRPDVLTAKAVVAIWSDRAAQSRTLQAEAEAAAAAGRLIGVHVKATPPTRLAADLRGLTVGSAAEPQHIADALRVYGVPAHGAADQSDAPDAPNAVDESAIGERAWAFVDGRGDTLLLHRYMRRFTDAESNEKARHRLAELAGADEPDGNANRPLMALLGSVVAGILMGVLFVLLMPKRVPEKIYVAAAGADGAYQRIVARYNEHLRPLGLELVPSTAASSSMGNLQLLADGKVQAAFVKGGLAGALRDPDYMNEARMKDRGQGWEHDWNKRLDRFQSLGRVMQEPLWVFTFGSAETNKLSELNGEPIHVGSTESGTRTLASLLLERNGVRNRHGRWLDNPIAVPKPDDQRPLGEARAMFLLQPAETKLVQALLTKVAPEKEFDPGSVVRTAKFSPRGRRIAVALGDQTARIWASSNGKELAVRKGHEDEINDVAFSPDGRTVATAGDDDAIRIWNAETGAPIAKIVGSGKDINSVAFSPDGKFVVSGSDSDRATIREIATGTTVRRLEGHEDDVNAASYSPDGKRIVTASRDNTAIIWNAETGEPQRVLNGHTKAVSSAQFSHDGRLVVTASWDGTARLWDADTGRQRLILQGHTDLVRGAEFSPDDKRVITASWDDTARVWDVTTGAHIRTLNGLRSNVNGVGFSPDGKLAMTASQDGHIRLWDTATWANVADYKTEQEGGKSNAHARKLHLLNFEADADAYIARYPFISKVLLPRGAVALEPHVPAEPVTLLATSVALVVDKTWADTHKSAVRAITDAIIHKPITGIDETTQKPRMFFRSGQFPTLNEPEYDVSPMAPPIYKSGDVPFLLGRLAKLNWVSFSTAAWIDEHAGTVVLSLIPLLGILIPLTRAVPAIYTWTVRRRILYWYRRLQALERRLDFEERLTRNGATTPEIERIDSAVSKIKVPLAYSDQYYDLRQHIELVRQRLQAKVAGGVPPPPTGKAHG